MKWDQGHESPDVIDRRGQGGGGGGMMGAGLFALAPLLLRHPAGIVILLLIVGGSVLMGVFKGGDRDENAQGVAETTGAQQTNDKPKQFVAFVLDDNQKNWQTIFANEGKPAYRPAKLVLFSNATNTACGYGQSATGPFYCPTDERVYIDLSFYDDLSRRFKAAGDFAQAYVIAHEVGHHVQKQLGISAAIQKLRRNERSSLDKREGESSASVRLELQADCFAGMWAHTTEQRKLLEAGDLDEALTAASAIGDDRMQKRSQGSVTPETFTHGTSAQRARWFRTGYDKGTLAQCDTFKASTL